MACSNVTSLHNVQSQPAMFERPSGSGEVEEESDDGICAEEKDHGLGFFRTLSDGSDAEVQVDSQSDWF